MTTSLLPADLQLGPPREAPWVVEAFVANQLVEQCVAAFLGPEPFLAFCAPQALLLAPPAPALTG